MRPDIHIALLNFYGLELHGGWIRADVRRTRDPSHST